MASPTVQIPETAEEMAGDDVDMGGEYGDVEVLEVDTAGEARNGLSELPDVAAEPTRRITFLDYLKSPVIEILVGSGDDETLLYAHQRLLIKSPFFAEACSQFSDITSRHRIELLHEDLDAMGCFLSYLYTGEYFPRRLSSSATSALEPDPTLPSPDSTGAALLKHARVYTLASRMGLPALKSLAHAKIHNTNSTARGEIAYARYVYANTAPDDATIRKPVAAYWATRSHVLRHEAEEEFRAMCLEFPQFGFDVLSLVLDQKERKGERGPEVGAVVVATPGDRSGRKRARQI